jgi:hypothetical protein
MLGKIAGMALGTKVIVGLSLALALSMGANVLQLRSAWVGEGEAKGQKEREQLAGQVAGFEKTAAVNEALNARASEDHAELVGELERIASSATANRLRARNVTSANPLPVNCIPGKERQDSVNQTLGPQERAP